MASFGIHLQTPLHCLLHQSFPKLWKRLPRAAASPSLVFGSNPYPRPESSRTYYRADDDAGVNVAIKAVGHPRDLRHLPVDYRPWRANCQRLRSRQADGVSHREALVLQYHADQAARGHGHNADAAQDSSVGTPRRKEGREPAVRAIGNHEAYDTFGEASKERALKVVLKNASASGGVFKENL